MTDKKITELTATTAPATTDIMPVVVDPATVPVTKKVTLANLFGVYMTTTPTASKIPQANTSGRIADGWLLTSGADGWTPAVNETWTYATSGSFTVTGDVSSVYTPGVKLKLTQTSDKYFYVASSIYGAPNTTVTITGGSDYVLTNAAISQNYYGRTSSPLGFPHWFNYTATISGLSGTVGSYAETDVIQRFAVTGRTCHLKIQKEITNKGSWASNMQMLLPIYAANLGTSTIFQNTPCVWANGAAPNAPKAFIRWTQTNLLTFTDLFNSSFFTMAELTNNDWLIINTSYEI